MINPADVILVPNEIRSPARLREYVELDRIAAENPLYEVFVLWFRQDLADTRAVVMRMSRELIRQHGWPLLVDSESRVVQFNVAPRED